MWDKLGWLNIFWQFLCEGLSSFNPKGFCFSGFSYGWLSSLCEGGNSFYAVFISEDSYLCFWLALLYSMSFFFLLFQLPSLHFCTVFDAISSNIDEFLLINPSANVFVFGDFFVHHNDSLIYSGGNDRSVELCYYSYSSNDHCLKSVQIRSYF